MQELCGKICIVSGCIILILSILSLYIFFQEQEQKIKDDVVVLKLPVTQNISFSQFDFDAALYDGYNVSVKISYDNTYPMSVEKRLIMTCLIKKALESKEVFQVSKK